MRHRTPSNALTPAEPHLFAWHKAGLSPWHRADLHSCRGCHSPHLLRLPQPPPAQAATALTSCLAACRCRLKGKGPMQIDDALIFAGDYSAADSPSNRSQGEPPAGTSIACLWACPSLQSAPGSEPAAMGACWPVACSPAGQGAGYAGQAAPAAASCTAGLDRQALPGRAQTGSPAR